MFILPYKEGSESAKNLALSINAKLLRSTEGKQKLFKSSIINWGNSKRFVGSLGRLLNHPKAVRNAVNKLTAFKILQAKGVSIPEFTEDHEVALQWLENEEWVVCRNLLESHSGQGIVLAKTFEELPENSKLYVKYFKKTYEFRVHVFRGEVIDYVQKRKRNDLPEEAYNKYIRSYNNGWVFCREDVIVNEGVKKLAVKAVNALGLDFGAVDVVMKAGGEAKVLEVNCAPALEGTTLESYTKAILAADLE